MLPGEMFVGFKKGRAGNDVLINESKLKRAQKFMEEDDEVPDKDFFSIPFSKPNNRGQRNPIFA